MSDQMTNAEADNEKRLVANQIMYELYRSGAKEQLELLRMYAEAAIKQIAQKESQ